LDLRTQAAKEKFKCNLGGGTDGSSIWVTKDVLAAALWRKNELGRYIIAHELAHVAQRNCHHRENTGGSMMDEHAYEVEASMASVAVVSGHPFRIRLQDYMPGYRNWGRAGHYYTVYLVLLAAGVDAPTASKTAFYAQLPDLVCELDATKAGLEFAETVVDLASGAADLPAAIEKGVQDLTRDLQVQIGLHALTGWECGPERERRRRILEKTACGSLDFGLAVHAFGDAFAHTRADSSKLYSAPMGHLWYWREPDRLNVHADLYRKYSQILFEITCVKTGADAHPGRKAGKKELSGYIEDILRQKPNNSASADENDRIKIISGICNTDFNAPLSYKPPDDPLPWYLLNPGR